MEALRNVVSSLLNEQDVARITKLSLATIRRRRLFKLPPVYLKIGSAVRYRPEDVAAWLQSCPTRGGSQAEEK